MSLFRDLKRRGAAGLADYIPVEVREDIFALAAGGRAPVFVDLTGVRMESDNLIPPGEEEFIPPFEDSWFEWRDQKAVDQAGAVFTVGARVRRRPTALPPNVDPTLLPDGFRLLQVDIVARLPGAGRISPVGTLWPVVNREGRQVRTGTLDYLACSRAVVHDDTGREAGLILMPTIVPSCGNPSLRASLRHSAENAVGVVKMACSMLHARNVALSVQVEGSKPGQRTSKRKGLTWHRLVIVAPGVKSKHGTIVPAADGDPVTRQHLQRGHFKTYTEDAPLFGRFTGRFWWSPHVRGSKDVGVVLKDYEVRSAE